MKHVAAISVPAKAAILDNHPAWDDAIKAFIDDPAGTIDLHVDALLGKIPCWPA